jgi:hypothetical protein
VSNSSHRRGVQQHKRICKRQVSRNNWSRRTGRREYTQEWDARSVLHPFCTSAWSSYWKREQLSRCVPNRSCVKLSAPPYPPDSTSSLIDCHTSLKHLQTQQLLSTTGGKMIPLTLKRYTSFYFFNFVFAIVFYASR